MDRYDCLKIENQLCFPLYACAKEVVRKYKPFLDPLDLTYTQYITMMILWERGEMNVKELGRSLYLDSGTLTPLLKKLETKGYISRTRSASDERNVLVSITDAGRKLRERAVEVPTKMGACMDLSPEVGARLYELLYKVLGGIGENKEVQPSHEHADGIKR